MKIVSTNIGEKKELVYKNKTIYTGIFKYPVATPIFLDNENVQGDAILDKKHHGGIHQAVYAYSLEHYSFWKKKYLSLDWQFGMFGENLTIADLDENKIHVGDTFKVGAAILKATLQRNPCYKLGLRFKDMRIVKQFWNTTMCGVYFKVVQKGHVKVGDRFLQLKSYPKNKTIAELYRLERLEKGIK